MFKVLIAEDEPLIRKGIIYCTDWARLNCGIPLEASNGEEAAEMIRQHRPDIVLLDVNMPLMDGLDALFQTRGLYFFVPIVVTGYSDFDYAKRAMYSGVQRYLLKPVVASELEEAIRKGARGLLKEVSLFDVYRGKGVDEGKKSVAFNLVLRADDRSLTSEEADEDVKSILETLKADCDAVLR